MRRLAKKSVIILFFLFLSIPSFSEDVIQVQIDQTPVVFETPPEIVGNTLMVPMKEFFEAMGAQVLWVESERMVIAYKDNTHLKLQIDKNVAFQNGNKFFLSQNPVVRNGHTLVPLQVIGETFNMNPIWDEKTKILSLNSSSENAGLKVFQDGVYKTRMITELGISLSIPYHWTKLSGPFRYGHEDDFESYSISLSSKKISSEKSLVDLSSSTKSRLLKRYGERITFTGEQTLNVNDSLQAKKIFLSLWENSENQRQLLYILKTGDTAYFMSCRYDAEVSEEDIVPVFDNVISTFTIRNQFVDSEEEHYVEFEPFYRYGIHLDQQYHSNMVIRNSKLNFSGELIPKHGLSHFIVRVTRNQNELNFSIPIKGSEFEDTIHIPFGLGKHNISISGVVDNTLSPEFKTTNSKFYEPDGTVLLMKFSVINIDPNTTRYKIPTQAIQSDNPQIKSISQLIVYKETSQYARAKAIYNWIIENIALGPKTNGSTNLSVFETAQGDPEEINQLYTALIRSIDIPARVVWGNKEEGTYFWTELKLNGNWLASDPVTNIQTPPKDTLSNVVFGEPLNTFQQKFTNSSIQPY